MTDGDVSVALTVLRVVRGWNQDDLAKASGVRNSAVSDYERGRKVPGLKTLIRLIAAMGYPLSAIDHVMSFIDALRSGTMLSEPEPDLPDRPDSEAHGGLRDAAAGESAALQWEVEQVSAEVGRAVSRMTRLMFVSLGRYRLRQHVADSEQTDRERAAAAVPAGDDASSELELEA
jgi:transcriptional regulator with XRE-family HTH domain